MNYLYHLVPPKMKGSTLYPLNQLKKRYPEIYKEAIKKYKGRERVLKSKIPDLNCRWPDTINLTAVHPKKLKAAFRKAKVPLRKIRWFKINPYSINPKLTTIYLYKYDNWKDEKRQDNYTTFNPKNLSKYNNISAKTIKYYKERFHKNHIRPLLFHFVPHIIYKGPISIKGVPIIEV